jgi:hypothetical protein
MRTAANTAAVSACDVVNCVSADSVRWGCTIQALLQPFCSTPGTVLLSVLHYRVCPPYGVLRTCCCFVGAGPGVPGHL